MPRQTVHAAVPLQPASHMRPAPRSPQPLHVSRPSTELQTQFTPCNQGLALCSHCHPPPRPGCARGSCPTSRASPTRPRPVAAFNLTAHFPCASSCPVATSRSNSPAPRQPYVPQPARAQCPANAHPAFASRTRPAPNSQLAHT